MARAPGPRRFAPLGAQLGKETSDLPKLQGVVFDVDGTLCKPQNYMFAEMRAALGIDKSVDILQHIESLPGPEQAGAHAAIQAIERGAMAAQEPQPGLRRLMDYLDSRRIRKGICTRNFDAPVSHLLTKFLPGSVFAPVVTRAFKPPKPDPAGILFIAISWGLVRRRDEPQASEGEGRRDEAEHVVGPGIGAVGDAATPSIQDGGVGASATPTDDANVGRGEDVVGDASNLIMVGDSIDDMTAGRRAGAVTVLLVNDTNKHLADHDHTDLTIQRLDELTTLLEDGFADRYVAQNG